MVNNVCKGSILINKYKNNACLIIIRKCLITNYLLRLIAESMSFISYMIKAIDLGHFISRIHLDNDKNLSDEIVFYFAVLGLAISF